jgi:tetratricopeptide (TPR) repeat protein
MSDEGADQRSRERWSQLAGEIERLTQTDPHAGVGRAEAWLADEDAGEGRARALLAFANALRFAGLHERAEPVFVEAETAFDALGLDDEAALTRIGHVEAFRYLGRYDEAIALANSNLTYLRSRGEAFALDAGRQTVNLGLVYWRRGDLEGALGCFNEARDTFERGGRPDFGAVALPRPALLLGRIVPFFMRLQAFQIIFEVVEETHPLQFRRHGP